MDKEREEIRKEIFDKPKEVIQEQANISSELANSDVNPELLRLFPPKRIKKIMAKEARRYQLTLRKKWRNWLESMSR